LFYARRFRAGRSIKHGVTKTLQNDYHEVMPYQNDLSEGNVMINIDVYMYICMYIYKCINSISKYIYYKYTWRVLDVGIVCRPEENFVFFFGGQTFSTWKHRSSTLNNNYITEFIIIVICNISLTRFYFQMSCFLCQLLCTFFRKWSIKTQNREILSYDIYNIIYTWIHIYILTDTNYII